MERRHSDRTGRRLRIPRRSADPRTRMAVGTSSAGQVARHAAPRPEDLGLAGSALAGRAGGKYCSAIPGTGRFRVKDGVPRRSARFRRRVAGAPDSHGISVKVRRPRYPRPCRDDSASSFVPYRHSRKIERGSIDLHYFQDQNSPIYAVDWNDLADDRWAVRAWHADRWLLALQKAFTVKDITVARPDLWSSLDPALLIPALRPAGRRAFSFQIQYLRHSGCPATIKVPRR